MLVQAVCGGLWQVYETAMALNLVKLCVGVETVEDLVGWREAEAARHRVLGQVFEQIHTTRMMPRRAEELLDGGSLYWVVKGNVQLRQRLTEIRRFTDGQGVARCHLVLDHELVLTHWQPRRAFQGWRYLSPADAPPDLGRAGAIAALPQALRIELSQLGLL